MRPYQLSFRSNIDVLTIHTCFSLERAAVVLVILESIFGLDPPLEVTDPVYLKLFTSSSLWPFYLDLPLKAIEVVYRQAQSPFCTLCRVYPLKLMKVLTPMLTLPLWSGIA